MTADAHRRFELLASPDIQTMVSPSSVLCLPIGALEQHGPHLPLNTDTQIAEGFAAQLVSRYGADFDIWRLPALSHGLSGEHAWAAGTVSLTASGFADYLVHLVGEYAKASSCRRFLLVNGHGGNRGILESMVYELKSLYSLTIGVIHPSSLSRVNIPGELPEIHAGLRETSVMMALAPESVHIEKLPADFAVNRLEPDEIRSFVLDRGTTWPWYSNDTRIAELGIMGSDPRRATPGLGRDILNSALDRAPDVVSTLLA